MNMMMQSRSLAMILGIVSLFIAIAPSRAQQKSLYPEDRLGQEEMAAHLRYIASDKLMGRMTGEPGNNEAARYIADEFRKSGLKSFPSTEAYFQRVPLYKRSRPGKGSLILIGDTLTQPNDMALRKGGPLKWSGSFVYVGYGMVDSARGIDEYKGMDVKGKVVIAQVGQKGEDNLRTALTSVAELKRKSAQAHGAVALVELYQGKREWKTLTGYFNRTGIETGPAGNGFPHFLVVDTLRKLAAKAQSEPRGVISIETEGIREENIQAQNVIGFIRGSDPTLQNEYLLLTAHYDHLGVGKPDGPSADSIYNGARDNGMGTVALIAAAKCFGANPPKRSVIIAAVTGEELGMLGSSYLAMEPPVPMEKIIFDLNIDGAGYDDTTEVTIVGLERTSAEPAIRQGAERYGLAAVPEPVVQKGLFNASDNISFATHGIPAPTFSEGFHSFGPEILKYYHRAADQADENFNFSYLLKFCKAFVHAARIVGDSPEAPSWKAGDSYEQAGKKLYHKN